jgi:signal transduction histidine kinase/ActR/RegA family two-component response regulator
MTDAAVRSEQVRTLYSQSVPVLLANVVNSVIVSATLWSNGPRLQLLAWTLAMTAMTIVRIDLRRRYWRASPDPTAAQRWGRYFVAGSLSAGLLWGAAGFLFFNAGGVLSQLLLTFVIGGMCAAAAGTLACHLPAYWAYMLPSLLPLVLRTLLVADALHLAMGGMVVVYALAMSVVARTNHRSMVEAFRLRFENQALLDRLSATQGRLEETNRTLEQRVADRTAELERQSEALRHAQRMETVGRLAGGIAHDFNNLLTVVLANVGLMLRGGTLEGGSRTAIEEVQAAADRGANLVRQLLAFSRRQRLAPRVIDLNKLVGDMDRLLTRLVGETIEMQLRLVAGGAPVKADASQLEQVVVNLVTNARDAMPRGGTLTISTAIVDAEGDHRLPAGRYVVLSVADTGVGMDDETRRLAFEPFFTTKDVGQGTGLGLATVYGIVEQSGGRVSVDSRPGEGSRFEIYLPKTTEMPGRDDTGIVVNHPVVGATIMLAEDEPEVRAAIERMLRQGGYQVIAAADGAQALALAGAYRGTIDLLISDVVMPKLGGAALARQLSAERPGLRVLFVSGYSWEGDLPTGDTQGTIDFMQKPVDLDLFMRKVAALVAATPSGAVPGPPALGRSAPK